MKNHGFTTKNHIFSNFRCVCVCVGGGGGGIFHIVINV